jgi:hypothetical protein
MNFSGLLLGVIVAIIIGAGHYIIIKGEYHFGTSWWPLLLVSGLLLILASLLVESTFWSGVLGISAFIVLYSIHELFQQKQRVAKGWFPENPKRKSQTDSEEK